MTEPVASDELTQGVKDAQAKFDEGMGAAGDASPYPMLAELRASAAVHRGWPEMGIPPSPDGEKQIFSVYTFDAVKEVFTDNKTFSTRCYEDDRAAPAGADHPRDAGTRARRVPQAARVRVRPFIDATMGGRSGPPAGGTHRRPVRGSQAGGPGRRGLHADPGAGHRRADRPTRGRYSRVSPARDRPVGISLRHGERDEGLRRVEGVLHRHPCRPSA